MIQALVFILNTLFSLLLIAFLLRMLLPLCRADARNPISQMVIRLTNPLVLPLRRILPTVGRLDTGALAGLLIAQLVTSVLIWLLLGRSLQLTSLLFIYSACQLLLLTCQFYLGAILVYALLSWVAPDASSPVSSLLTSVVSPILRPFQRLIPPLGGLDLSALFAWVAIQALLILLRELMASNLIPLQ